MKQDLHWDELASQFSARKIGDLSEVAEAHGIDITLIDRIIGNRVPEPVDSLSKVLLEAAENIELAAFYVYARCQFEWEQTIDHAQLKRAIEVAYDAWQLVKQAIPQDRFPAVSLLFRHLNTLVVCMDAENALNCSCPVDLRRKSELVASESDQLLDELASLPTTDFNKLLYGC